MKSFNCIIFILLSIVFSSACTEIPPENNEPSKIELRKKSLELIEADQRFSFELFHQVCSLSQEENIMISPLSISYALGMTYNGARGGTGEEFVSVLHFDGLSKMEVNESYKDLMGQLKTLDEKVELVLANSIWHVDWATVKEEFIQTNQEYFDAQVAPLDFSDPASVDVINDWIEAKTNDKIKDMLDYIPADAYMYLINAIYFNATWKYEFDEDDTYNGNFYLQDGETGEAAFMHIEGDFKHAWTAEFQAVELPYGDGAFSMVVLLPVSSDQSIDEFVEFLDLDAWEEWFTHASVQHTTVNLPKFKYAFKDLLNDPLKNLGLVTAFSDSADFSDITEQVWLYISRVIHQSYIDVNEEGTEAAAATIVEMRWESATGNYFTADRPFVYIIKENSTNAILFIGKVGRPEYF
ncbi:serpin family protein [Bacteroidota bacterium]